MFSRIPIQAVVSTPKSILALARHRRANRKLNHFERPSFYSRKVGGLLKVTARQSLWGYAGFIEQEFAI
jgi:hypothetical protein